VIAHLTGDQAVASQLKDHLPEVAISSLVLAELRFGARASARTSENIERLNQFLQIVEVADFDDASADAYSEYVSSSPNGTSSAKWTCSYAVALANDAVLVTHNTRHLRILKDWFLRTGWLERKNENRHAGLRSPAIASLGG
jgi:predicted nucleic acid-binding protein